MVSVAPHATSGKRFRSTWVCRCVCGREVVVSTSWLTGGDKRSCGCRNYMRPHGNAKQDPQVSSWNALIARMKNAARRRRIEWGLPFDTAKILCSRECRWCGQSPNQKFNYRRSLNGYMQGKYLTPHIEAAWIKFNGIDRINNDLGYYEGNCWPCCKSCNFARNTMTVDEFHEWIRRIAQHALGIA